MKPVLTTPKEAPVQPVKKPDHRPTLSMIWVEEPDGNRTRLVAHWTLQD